MRVAMLIEGLRTWGSAALLIFPAHRRLRRVEAENAELRKVAYVAASCAQAVVESAEPFLRTTP